MLAIFDAATEMKATACAIVDSTVGIPTHDSLEALVRPIIDGGIDFVAPLYLRHKYDAAILNGIVYPLTRALYGKRVHRAYWRETMLSPPNW